MDENNIQILHKDLTEEFHALAKTHTTAIEQLLEDFNDDHMLLRLESEAYECERLQAEREDVTVAQPSTSPLTKEVAQEPAEEDKPRQEPAQTTEPT